VKFVSFPCPSLEAKLSNFILEFFVKKHVLVVKSNNDEVPHQSLIIILLKMSILKNFGAS
jgi:hypothetical protein